MIRCQACNTKLEYHDPDQELCFECENLAAEFIDYANTFSYIDFKNYDHCRSYLKTRTSKMITQALHQYLMGVNK